MHTNLPLEISKYTRTHPHKEKKERKRKEEKRKKKEEIKNINTPSYSTGLIGYQSLT